MANLILVLGPTGTGKSTAIQNLDPEKTYIFNTLGKDLPFKKGRFSYTLEKKNMKVTTSYEDVIKALSVLPTIRPNVNTIIIDDARHIMESEYIKRATEVGYTKFTQLGQHFEEVLRTARSIGNKNLDIFLLLHTDDVTNGTNIVSQKAKLVGKLVEDHFNPLELVSICLFTNVQLSQDGTQYQFITNRTNVDGVTIPAKSPFGMFDLYIPNDFQIVKELIQKYYEEEINDASKIN